MSEATKTGAEVRAQARDNSLENTEPLAWRGILGAFLTFVLLFLKAQGLLTDEESGIISSQAEVIVDALIVLIPAAFMFWGRLKAYAPRTAAKIAVQNSALPVSAEPTLMTPP